MEDEKGRCDKGGERKGDKTTKTDLMPRKVLTSSVPCTCVHTHIRTYSAVQCICVQHIVQAIRVSETYVLAIN